jgi:hypothetical protein
MLDPDPIALPHDRTRQTVCALGQGLWAHGECMSCELRPLNRPSEWGHVLLALQLVQRCEAQSDLLEQCDAACLRAAERALLSLEPQGTSELGRALFRACDRLRDELGRRADLALSDATD